MSQYFLDLAVIMDLNIFRPKMVKADVSGIFADEKRKSIADFRDSSFNQSKEKVSVSVKAISALYLSKVAHQEPTKVVNIRLFITCNIVKDVRSLWFWISVRDHIWKTVL